MAVTREIDAYVEQLRALFPRGRAWPEARGPVWDQLLRSLAVELQRIDGRLADLLRERDPRTAIETLEDYERELGLPDPCFGGGQTTDERRQLVVALTLMQGGQSPEYFVALAALFGRAVTVEEVFPLRAGISRAGDRCGSPTRSLSAGGLCVSPLTEPAAPFEWWVLAEATEARHARAGECRAGDPVIAWGDRLLECLFARFRPAHTECFFAFDARAAIAADLT